MRQGLSAASDYFFVMSKGNMLLGHARGKVGDLVFSRSNGKQVVRARAAVVRNPQTDAQMIQRILLATVAQAYSRFSAITDHSFEGIQPGQRSMSYFLRTNIGRLRSLIGDTVAAGGSLDDVFAFTPVGSNEYAANSFIISKGQLPEVSVLFSGSVAALMPLAENTYQGVLDAYGLQRGDQLTFISTQGTTGSNTTFQFARVILDPQSADGSSAPLDSPFVVGNLINMPNERNEGSFAVLEYSAGNVRYAFSAYPMSGAAIIVSRKSPDGSWMRSNATLALNEVAVAGWQHSMQECIDLFRAGGLDTLNERYLNNAGRGRLAAAGGGLLMRFGSVTSQSEAPYFEMSDTDSVRIVSAGSKVIDGKEVVTLYDADGNEYILIGSSAYLNNYRSTIIVGADSRTANTGAPQVQTLAVGTKLVGNTFDVADDDKPVNSITQALVAYGVPLGVWTNP